MENNELPLAVRRSRRSNVGVKPEPVEMITQCKTPKRSSRKKVRFSDPGASGLTPFIRRTSLTTPSKRRASTPSRLYHDTPIKPVPTPQSLRHVQEGRVERRQRRDALRTAVEKIDTARQRSDAAAKAKINNLQSELKARDREIYELQNATIVIDTDRIWDLERQVDDLQDKLRQARQADETRMDWTVAARDPYADPADYDEDDMMFGNATMAQLEFGTPSRARSSFPTPPATSPVLAATPSRSRMLPGPMTPTSVRGFSSPIHMGVQTSLPDLALLAEKESLERETQKLSETLQSYKDFAERLSQRLPQRTTGDEVSAESVLNIENIDKQVEVLLQNLSDRTTAVSNLTSQVSSLGFPGNDTSAMLHSITTSLRTARLELEYLTPGEVTLPLTSHGAEVLDLLLDRLRDLAKRVKEGDDAVDEYHAIELNLRQQLDSRVSTMDTLKEEITKAGSLLKDRTTRVEELEVGNDRLKGAIDGYVRDISELEHLITKMDSESKIKDATMTAHTSSIKELEARLASATQKATDLADELDVAQQARKKQLASVNRRSGDALALRDARVVELREEVSHVNAALREAHEIVHSLRVENGKGMEENRDLTAVVEGMKGELQRVLEMSETLRGEQGAEKSGGDAGQVGRFLEGRWAKRRSGVKRQRDSGLALMDEDEVDA